MTMTEMKLTMIGGAFALAMGLALVGCGDNGSDNGRIGDAPLPTGANATATTATNDTAAALSQVVFVRAGDIAITAQDAKDAAEFLAASKALAKRPVKDRDYAKWINRTALRSVPSLLSAALLDREFRKRGVTASDAATDAVLARYRKTVRMPKASVDEIASAFGDKADYFRRQFARECRLEQYLADCEGIAPTDEDVEIVEAQLKQSATRNEAENAQAKARGEAAWKRLASGESWDAVAKACSEDRLLYGDDCDYAHEWETFSPAHFYLPEVAKAVAGLKAGAFTKPVETDEGLVIVKVLGTEGEGDGVQYRCARILFRLKVKMEVPERADLKRQLERENRAEAQRDLLADIRKGVAFEHPLGTNFTYRVMPESGKPVGLEKKKAGRGRFGKGKSAKGEKEKEAGK